MQLAQGGVDLPHKSIGIDKLRIDTVSTEQLALQTKSGVGHVLHRSQI